MGKTIYLILSMESINGGGETHLFFQKYLLLIIMKWIILNPGEMYFQAFDYVIWSQTELNFWMSNIYN